MPANDRTSSAPALSRDTGSDLSLNAYVMRRVAAAKKALPKPEDGAPATALDRHEAGITFAAFVKAVVADQPAPTRRDDGSLAVAFPVMEALYAGLFPIALKLAETHARRSTVRTDLADLATAGRSIDESLALGLRLRFGRIELAVAGFRRSVIDLLHRGLDLGFQPGMDVRTTAWRALEEGDTGTFVAACHAATWTRGPAPLEEVLSGPSSLFVADLYRLATRHRKLVASQLASFDGQNVIGTGRVTRQGALVEHDGVRALPWPPDLGEMGLWLEQLEGIFGSTDQRRVDRTTFITNGYRQRLLVDAPDYLKWLRAKQAVYRRLTRLIPPKHVVEKTDPDDFSWGDDALSLLASRLDPYARPSLRQEGLRTQILLAGIDVGVLKAHLVPAHYDEAVAFLSRHTNAEVIERTIARIEALGTPLAETDKRHLRRDILFELPDIREAVRVRGFVRRSLLDTTFWSLPSDVWFRLEEPPESDTFDDEDTSPKRPRTRGSASGSDEAEEQSRVSLKTLFGRVPRSRVRKPVSGTPPGSEEAPATGTTKKTTRRTKTPRPTSRAGAVERPAPDEAEPATTTSKKPLEPASATKRRPASGKRGRDEG